MQVGKVSTVQSSLQETRTRIKQRNEAITYLKQFEKNVKKLQKNLSK